MQYVDNDKLYSEICKWKQEIRDKGHHVKMPDSIGKAILLIATRFTGYWKFSKYTQLWKDLMISDAVDAVVKGLINFDEVKYKNPHAYITQACFNAFIHRIQQEKREMATKYRFFINHVYDDQDEDMAQMVNEEFLQDIHDKLNTYEKSIKQTPKARPDIPTLDQFYDYEENTTETEPE